jgi:hypothetical protein
MPRLLIKTEELFSKRTNQIRSLVKSVASAPSQLQIRVQKHALGHIICVSDLFSAHDSPTERLFQTTSNVLYGQYYEIWVPDKNARNHHLFQNYFHLFALPTKTQRDQLFCLHSEPEEPLDQMQNRVKATPHIHVKTKEERLLPIAKAHLPISYSTTESVLKSINDFDKVFTEAITVIRHEVVDRYR